MNKVMTEYINSMTGNSIETLEKIISLQYRKFIRFYRLVEGYSDTINNIEYEFNSSSSLDVILSFNTKKNLDNIKEELELSMEKNCYNGIIKVTNKRIFMSIILDEDDMGK